MPDIFSEKSSHIQTKSYSIPSSHNCLSVSLKDQTWLKILQDGHEIVTERGLNSCISFILPSGTYTVKSDGQIEKITSKLFEENLSPSINSPQKIPSLLGLTSDAPDQHIVDGVGEIPANGESFCTITIHKLSIDGTPLTNNEHQDELYIRCTGGNILDQKGDQHIRSICLQSGQASFRLVSEPNPKIITVSVFSKDPSISKAEIQIEFV